MSNLVKYFSSDMVGAPALNEVQGALVALLDACLVTGFALSTISKLEATAGVATATVNGTNPYKEGQIILISGAEQDAYNGEKIVTSVLGATFSFKLEGNPASPATTQSTINAKVAPLNWEKAFSGTNKAAYRSKSKFSNRHFLRVDDSVKTPRPPFTATYPANGAKYAYVAAVENMTDIDTLLGMQAPFDANNPNLNWGQNSNNNEWGWLKWYYAKDSQYDREAVSAGNRRWVIIGDDKFFYLLPAPRVDLYGGRFLYAFGDVASYRKGDAFNTIIKGTDSKYDYGYTPATRAGGYAGIFSGSNSGAFILKGVNQVGGSIPATFYADSFGGSINNVSGFHSMLTFPNMADMSCVFTPFKLLEYDASFICLRAAIKGLYFIPHRIDSLNDGTILEHELDRPPEERRKMLILSTSASSDNAKIAISINGSWGE